MARPSRRVSTTAPSKAATRTIGDATTVANLASLTTSPFRDVSHCPPAVTAPLLSPPPDDNLPVTIFLDRTGNRKATAPLPRPHRTVETGALLDTGSLAGDFISQHVVTQLQGDGLSYLAPHLLKLLVVALTVPAIVASFFST
jgi:hypothetical protein